MTSVTEHYVNHLAPIYHARLERYVSQAPPKMSSFSDPKTMSEYAERTIRLVPGLLDLQRHVCLALG